MGAGTCESGAAGTGDLDGDGLANNVDTDDDGDGPLDTALIGVASCTIILAFDPPATPGLKSNALNVSVCPGGTLAAITQTGTAISQLSAVLTTSFIQTPDVTPSVAAAGFENGTIILTNLSNQGVTTGTIAAFLTKGTEFSILTHACSTDAQVLAAGANCVVTLRYLPTLAGTDTAAVTFTSAEAPRAIAPRPLSRAFRSPEIELT